MNEHPEQRLLFPQKLTIDAIIEEETNKIILLEFNGENSGYKGMEDSSDITRRIADIIGRNLEGKKILVNPLFPEFFDQGNNLRLIKYLRKKFGIDILFSPLIYQNVTAYGLENAIGELDEFDSLIGFGGFLERCSENFQGMINAPNVEMFSRDKLLQYLILSGMDEIPTPDTLFSDISMPSNTFHNWTKSYKEFVFKTRGDSNGNGTSYLDSRWELTKFLESLRDGNEEVAYELLTQYGFRGKSFERYSARRFLKTVYSDDVEAGSKLITKYSHNSCYLFQNFIKSKPIQNKNSGLNHVGRARLIWFGEYLGGYWALSDNPIQQLEPEENIVNYSTTQSSQKFSNSEESRFRAYSERVFPMILNKLQGYNDGKFSQMKKKAILKAVLGQNLQ